MIDYDSPSARTLLAIAGRRVGVDVTHCRLAFAHLGAAARLRRDLQATLTRHRLSELQFAILVVLFENEAKPIAMARSVETDISILISSVQTSVRASIRQPKP